MTTSDACRAYGINCLSTRFLYSFFFFFFLLDQTMNGHGRDNMDACPMCPTAHHLRTDATIPAALAIMPGLSLVVLCKMHFHFTYLRMRSTLRGFIFIYLLLVLLFSLSILSVTFVVYALYVRLCHVHAYIDEKRMSCSLLILHIL